MNVDHLENLSQAKKELSEEQQQTGELMSDMRQLHGNFLKLEQVNKTYETNMDLLRKDIVRLKKKLGEMGDLADKRKESICVLVGEFRTRGMEKRELGKLLPYGTDVNGISLKSNIEGDPKETLQRYIYIILIYMNCGWCPLSDIEISIMYYSATMPIIIRTTYIFRLFRLVITLFIWLYHECFVYQSSDIFGHSQWIELKYSGAIQEKIGSLNDSADSLELDLKRIEREVEAGGGLRDSEFRAFDSNMFEGLDIANNDEGTSYIWIY